MVSYRIVTNPLLCYNETKYERKGGSMQRTAIKKVSAVFILTLMMGGCAQPSPNTKKGALVGAASGAVVSGVTGGNVLKGAAVGTVVGGTVGYISDQ